MATPPSTDAEEAAAVARRLLDAVERGELTAPPRLVRLLEAMVLTVDGGAVDEHAAESA